MKILGRKTVIEYMYDSKEEAEEHEEEMRRKGWSREAIIHFLVPNYRSYSKTIERGTFL